MCLMPVLLHEQGESVTNALRVCMVPAHIKSNSDARNDKVTVVKLLGEEASRRNVSELFAECRSRMNQFRGFDSASMIHMVDQIEARMK